MVSGSVEVLPANKPRVLRSSLGSEPSEDDILLELLLSWSPFLWWGLIAKNKMALDHGLQWLRAWGPVGYESKTPPPFKMITVVSKLITDRLFPEDN